MMNKYNCLLLVNYLLFSLVLSAQSIDHSYVLGFNGIYRKNSWTPLIIRLSNKGKSLSGQLVVETENTSTAYEQKRQYIKPVDLSSGSFKEISFVLPMGNHSRDIRFYFKEGETVLFENTISLKQKGVKTKLILGISPFPDLGFLNTHPDVDSRSIVYPHIDNLPENSNAYNAVDIVSMHREMMSKLTINQFKALSEWVNQGGVFVAWGGRSPSPDKWNYLPSQIRGLKIINTANSLFPWSEAQLPTDSLLINTTETSRENLLFSYRGNDLISRKRSGSGSIFFIGFDYTGQFRNWPGLDELWTIIFNSEMGENLFSGKMSEDYLLENYISILDNSGFAYQDKKNAGLILLLTLSATVSMMVFILIRRKSRHIYSFITGFMTILFVVSFIIYFSLYNKSYRTDCFVVSCNVIFNYGESNQSILFKDVLLGSSNKTASDIILSDDSLSVLKQTKFENMTIESNPELYVKNIELDQWSSKILRFERSIKNVLTVRRSSKDGDNILHITNNSDYFIHNTFLYMNGFYINLENLLPQESMTVDIPVFTDNNLYSNSSLLEMAVLEQYARIFGDEETLLLGGFINEELFPLEFSRSTWRKKTVNLILATEDVRGVSYE